MPIVFSDHAKLQLRRRKISQKLILENIYKSKQSAESFRGRKLRRIAVGDKLLEIVTKTEGNRITVITAYYLEK